MSNHKCEDFREQWKVDYQNTLRCVCGKEQVNLRQWIPEPEDFARWKGQRVRLFNYMKDGQPHERTDIWEAIGRPLNFSAVVSDLRDAGAVIPRPTRDGKKIWYVMTGWVDHSTLQHGIHYPECKTCRCTHD
jgi:hypothetical protein